MGAWGSGLLENDTAGDAIGVLTSKVVSALRNTGTVKTREAAGTLAARIGLVTRYGAWLFRSTSLEEAPIVDAIRAVVRSNRAALDHVAPKAGPLLDALLNGATLPEADHRHLLRAKHGRAFLQGLADELSDWIDAVLAETSDYLAAEAGAYFDVLGAIASQIELPERRVKRWLKHHKKLATRVEDPEFAEPYVETLRKILKRAVKLAPESEPGS